MEPEDPNDYQWPGGGLGFDSQRVFWRFGSFEGIDKSEEYPNWWPGWCFLMICFFVLGCLAS